MRRKALVIALLAVVAGIVAGWYFLTRSEWARIDMCLDRGGRWDYRAGLCEQVQP